MNSKNKILVGCLALLLTLSVGYALFSDTITINGTATAKGSFDMTVTCEVVTSETATDAEKGTVMTVGGTGNCQIDDDTITTTSTLTKPTDQVGYRITFTNNGTIPALLKSIISSNNADYFDTSGILHNGDKFYVNEYYLMSFYGFLNGGSFKRIADSQVSTLNLKLNPGEKFTAYVMNFWANSDNTVGQPQKELPKEGSNINYNLTALFEQVTN